MNSEALIDYEMVYKGATQDADLNPVSRSSANAVIDRLFQNRNDARAADLTRRIHEAAGQGDTEAIFRLTDELKKAKQDEEQRNSRLHQIAEDFTFAEVMRAFPRDYKSLVYELGLLVLQTTQEGLHKGKKTPRRDRSTEAPKGTVYIISHGGTSIEAMKNAGAAKLPGTEKEFFEFLGFDISADGRLLDPPTFVNIRGETVPANSKKAIIEDILAGNKHWTERGYRAKVKESTSNS
jgi:hypothetical protein